MPIIQKNKLVGTRDEADAPASQRIEVCQEWNLICMGLSRVKPQMHGLVKSETSDAWRRCIPCIDPHGSRIGQPEPESLLVPHNWHSHRVVDEDVRVVPVVEGEHLCMDAAARLVHEKDQQGQGRKRNQQWHAHSCTSAPLFSLGTGQSPGPYIRSAQAAWRPVKEKKAMEQEFPTEEILTLNEAMCSIQDPGILSGFGKQNSIPFQFFAMMSRRPPFADEEEFLDSTVGQPLQLKPAGTDSVIYCRCEYAAKRELAIHDLPDEVKATIPWQGGYMQVNKVEMILHVSDKDTFGQNAGKRSIPVHNTLMKCLGSSLLGLYDAIETNIQIGKAECAYNYYRVETGKRNEDDWEGWYASIYEGYFKITSLKVTSSIDSPCPMLHVETFTASYDQADKYAPAIFLLIGGNEEIRLHREGARMLTQGLGVRHPASAYQIQYLIAARAMHRRNNIPIPILANSNVPTWIREFVGKTSFSQDLEGVVDGDIHKYEPVQVIEDIKQAEPRTREFGDTQFSESIGMTKQMYSGDMLGFIRFKGTQKYYVENCAKLVADGTFLLAKSLIRNMIDAGEIQAAFIHEDMMRESARPQGKLFNPCFIAFCKNYILTMAVSCRNGSSVELKVTRFTYDMLDQTASLQWKISMNLETDLDATCFVAWTADNNYEKIPPVTSLEQIDNMIRRRAKELRKSEMKSSLPQGDSSKRIRTKQQIFCSCCCARCGMGIISI